MSDSTDIIQRPAGETFVVIRESYLAITNGDKSAAILLNWGEQWYKYKLKARAQARAQNAVKKAHGEAADQDEGLWIYRSAAEIAAEDLLGTLSDKTVSQKMKLLEKLGFFKLRNNPHQPYDRKLQYLFCRANVQAAVDAWSATRPKPDLDPAADDGAEAAREEERRADAASSQQEENNASGSHSEKLPDGSGSEEDDQSEKLPNEDGELGDTNRKNFRMNKEIPSIASSLDSGEEEAPAPQAGEQPVAPNASSSEEASPDELLDALLDEAEGGQAEGITDQPASEAPPHTPDLSELTTGEGGQQETQSTAGEEVPAAGGGAAVPADEVAAVNAQLNRYLNRRWLAPYQLGDTVMPPLSTEIVDGLDRAEIPQMVSLEQLRELHNQTRRNISQRKREQATNPGLPGLNYTTELLRLLHEHVEQRLAVREMAQQAQAAQPEAAGDLRVSGHSEWQVGDQVIYMREPCEIVRITRLKITVALLSDREIEQDIIRSGMSRSTLRPYRPQQRTG